MSRRMRAAVGVLGVFLFGGAALVPTEPIAGGGRTLEAWWGMALAAAVIVAAILGASRRSSLMGALLVLGSAGQLALTKPTWLQYVRLRPHELLSGTLPLACGLVLLHLVVVLRVGLRERRRWGNGWSVIVRPRHLPFLGLLFAFAAAHATLIYPHRGDPKYLVFWALQLVAAAFFFVLDLATVLLIGDALAERSLARGKEFLRDRLRVPGDDGPPRGWDRRIAPITSLLVVLVCGGLSYGVLDGVPHVPDGIAYRIQAKALAAGTLSEPAPVEAEAFRVYLIDHRDDRLFVVTNPGWPAILALGEKIGWPWLVNPLLAGLCIVLLHRLAGRLGDHGRATALMLLLACSPWFLWLGASFMTHVATLAFALAGGLALAEMKGRWADFPLAFFGGCAMGVVFVIRPLDGLLIGGAAMAAFLVHGHGAARRRWGIAAIFGLGCVASGAMLFLFNHALTGSWMETPINRYLAELWYPGTNALGFGPEIGNTPNPWGPLDPLRGHGWLDVLLNTNQNIYNLNYELFGWGVGSLCLIVVRFLRPGWSVVDRWMAWFLLVCAGAYNLYWFSGGPDFGPRYWFLMIVPCLWLSLSGAREMATVLRERTFVEDAASRLTVMLAVLGVVSLLVFMPWRACAKYDGYRGFHGRYRDMAADGSLDDALVFIETDEEIDFGCALMLNEPGLPVGRPIFARDLGRASRDALSRAFPDRRVVRLRGVKKKP